MIDYQPTAGHIQAACRAGLQLKIGEYSFWHGKPSQLKMFETHYKNIFRNYEKGRTYPG